MFGWLMLLKNYFEESSFVGEGLELAILISSGFLLYLVISSFVGNVDFIIKNFSKPKINKNDVQY